MSNETDQTLNCRDCKQNFVFTAGEQKFFAERQLSPRTRCKPCSDKRKAAKEAGEAPGTFNPSGGYTTTSVPTPEAPPYDGGGKGPGRRGGGRGRRGQNAGGYED
jgi:hypothetical protein